VLSLACLLLSGILLGGAWSLHRQHQPAGRVVVTALLGLLALAAAVLRLVGEQQG
jgi:hypothetical protein